MYHAKRLIWINQRKRIRYPKILHFPHQKIRNKIQKLLGLLGHSQQDSTGYLNQVRRRDTVFIPIQINKKYSVANHKKTERAEQFLSRYTFHLPILSQDGKKAFVALDYYCGGLCGQGYEFILEKINGKWKVLKCDYTWVA